MKDSIEEEFTLQALRHESNREQLVGLPEALKYLNSSTSTLNRSDLESIAHTFDPKSDISPEIKFYAGWAFLDSAYPGLFSLDDSPTDNMDSDSGTLARLGMEYFRQLDSRTMYLDKTLPVEKLANKQIQLNEMLFGIKARIITCFDELITLKPSGETPKSIANQKKKIAITTSAKLEATGKQIREQEQIAERIINNGDSLHSRKSLENFYANLRGIEAECALLGAVWTDIAENNKHGALETFALPASVRTDFGINADEPKGDVIFYHEGEKYAIEITRSKVSSARFGKNYTSNGKTIHFYGDRDLRLPSYQKIKNKITVSPDFKGYKSESKLVMHQLIGIVNRLNGAQ